MQTIAPDPIMKIAMGFMAAKYLFVASEIGLFEALEKEPATLEELAKRVAAPVRTVGIVACCDGQFGTDRRRRHSLPKQRGRCSIPRREARP